MNNLLKPSIFLTLILMLLPFMFVSNSHSGVGEIYYKSSSQNALALIYTGTEGLAHLGGAEQAHIDNINAGAAKLDAMRDHAIKGFELQAENEALRKGKLGYQAAVVALPVLAVAACYWWYKQELKNRMIDDSDDDED